MTTPVSPESDPPQHHVILANDLIDLIGAAMGIAVGSVNHMVLDLPCNGVATIYVKFFGDTRLLAMNMSLFKDAAFVTGSPPEDTP